MHSKQRRLSPNFLFVVLGIEPISPFLMLAKNVKNFEYDKMLDLRRALCGLKRIR